MKPPKTKRVRRVLLAATVGLATLTPLTGCGGNPAPGPLDRPDTGPPDSGTDAGGGTGDAGR